MSKHTDRELWASARILERLAERRQQVRDHVRAELALVDSFSDHTPGASDPDGTPRKPLTGKCVARIPIEGAGTWSRIGDDAELQVMGVCGRSRPCGEHDSPVALTAVERAAERRMQLNNNLSMFEVQCKTIVVAASDAMRAADHILGTRLEVADEAIKECRDGQFGREGAIEWGDPLCRKGADKVGLCHQHYMAARRWREKNGLDTSRMVEPGAA